MNLTENPFLNLKFVLKEQKIYLEIAIQVFLWKIRIIIFKWVKGSNKLYPLCVIVVVVFVTVVANCSHIIIFLYMLCVFRMFMQNQSNQFRPNAYVWLGQVYSSLFKWKNRSLSNRNLFAYEKAIKSVTLRAEFIFIKIQTPKSIKSWFEIIVTLKKTLLFGFTPDSSFKQTWHKSILEKSNFFNWIKPLSYRK